MSTYENAPGTRLVATHCAVCARPLLDAKSVELGIGPTCREKYGFNRTDITEEGRAAANKIVHGIAIGAWQNAALVEALTHLRQLGFPELADIIGTNRRKFEIIAVGDKIGVKGPMTDRALAEWRQIPGRSWDNASGGFLIPVTEKRRLWDILRRHFAGTLGTGPKGLFVVA